MNTRFFGGVLLVAGTAIGAGMLAMPILTGMAGFYPSLILLFLVWLGTVFTALLVLEVNLWYHGNVNLITMAKKTMGKGWATLTWIFFLLLLYSLTAAYLAGSGRILGDTVHALFDVSLPDWLLPLPFFLIFGAIIYFGIKPVDYVNRWMMIGLAAGYAALLALVFPEVDSKLLQRSEFSYLWVAVPLVVTSFGFHVVIPSLTSYLHRDAKMVRKVILFGSLLTLAVYIVWEWAFLGAMPIDNHWFYDALRNGQPATEPLAILLDTDLISTFARFFSFFAIITSFLGITLSLANFLADGLELKNTYFDHLKVTCLTFIPPLVFVFIYPQGFILALQYGGVFVAVISGILPALMAWKGRYILNKNAEYRVRGGKVSLVLAILGSIAVIILAIAVEIGLLKNL